MRCNAILYRDSNQGPRSQVKAESKTARQINFKPNSECKQSYMSLAPPVMAATSVCGRLRGKRGAMRTLPRGQRALT